MRRLVTPGMLARHVLAVALIGGFLGLGWWQVSRASAGNTLSWAYAIEWPVFAAFVAVIWFREIRDALRAERAPARAERADPVQIKPVTRSPVRVARRPVTAGNGPPDAELDAYNDYLAWLNANPGARASDYPARRGGRG